MVEVARSKCQENFRRPSFLGPSEELRLETSAIRCRGSIGSISWSTHVAVDSERTRYFDNRFHAPCRIMVYTIGDPSYSSLACKRLGTANGARKPSVQFPSNLYIGRNRVELDKRVNVNGAIQPDDFPPRRNHVESMIVSTEIPIPIRISIIGHVTLSIE